MRILIAETDLMFLASMKQALEEAGYEVATAADGMGAWGYLADTTPPHLVVTRLNLGSGKPPGTALGAHAYSHRIPIIYIPATAERAELADAQHGLILVKPFEASDLVAAVNRLLCPTLGALPV